MFIYHLAPRRTARVRAASLTFRKGTATYPYPGGNVYGATKDC